MKYPEKDNRTQEIIEEILHIQTLSYNGWFGGLSRKIKVDQLHSELDKMGYGGDRPPRQWKQFNNGKPKPNRE